jgi:transposase-like protein
MGLLDRNTKEVRVMHIPDTKRETLQSKVREHVAPGSDVFTDEWVSYQGLDREYVHNVINHAETYVKGNIHTNGIENFLVALETRLEGNLRQRRAVPPVSVSGRTGVPLQQSPDR